MQKLTETKGSYAYELMSHRLEIDEAYQNYACSAAALKSLVSQIVLKANDKSLKDKSEATKRFLMHLSRSKTKTDIITLVYSAMMKSDGLGVI